MSCDTSIREEALLTLTMWFSDTHRRDVCSYSWWFASATTLGTFAYCKLSYDASLAVGELGPQLILGFIFLVCVFVIFSTICVAAVARAGMKPFKVLAASVGLGLVVCQCTPTLDSRIAHHRTELETFARSVRSGKKRNWPVTVGTFTFLGGEALENGVVLRTQIGLESSGLIWRSDGAVTGNRYSESVIDGEWSTFSYD